MAFAFECTACGKCCSTGPALSIDEIFKYQNEFIMSGIFSGRGVDRLRPESRIAYPGGGIIEGHSLTEYLATLKDICAKWSNPHSDYYVVISATGVGFHGMKSGRCEQLDADNRCKLHADKPIRCRSVPFGSTFPESLQEFPLRHFKSYGCMHEGATTESAIIIYRDREIVDPEYKRDFVEQQDALRSDRKVYNSILALAQERIPFAPELKILVEAIASGGQLETAMTPLLFVILMHERAPKAAVLRYLECQRALIDAAINAAIKRKNSSERIHTAKYRSYLAEYERLRRAIDRPDFEEFLGAIRAVERARYAT